MSSLGETLRRARVEQGLELEEIARRLKINPKYFSAIEANDRASFPSAFFYRSFVQQYAAALSFNAEQIDKQLDAILSSEAPPPLPGQDANPIRKREPDLQIRPSRRGLYVSLASAATLLAASGAFYLWWTKTGHQSPFSSVIQGVAAAAPKKTIDTPPPSPAPPPAPQAVPAAMVTQPAPVSHVPPKIDHVVLNLVAKEQTWLSVYSDGKHVYAGVLRANESKAIEGKQFARMTVGNAGGVEVQFNGKTIGALGAHGQVRTVLFTPENFEIVQTAKDGV
jgi:cytoskeletal protein RodZ